MKDTRVVQRWADSHVILHHADCLDLMPQLADSGTKFDLIIADLPYGTTRNHWDKELPNKTLWWCYHQLAHPHTPIILFGTGAFSARLIVENIAEYRYTLIWDKQAVSGFLNAKRQPLRSHEDLNVFYRQQPVYNPQMVFTGCKTHSRGKLGGKKVNHYGQHVNTKVPHQDGWQYPRSILTFPRPKVKGHPSQKPVALMEWLVATYSNPGATVLDNVCGSGTTLIAARNLGRRCVGIEVSDKYCAMAAARLASGETKD